MPDVVERLERYAAAIADRVEPVSIEEIDAAASVRRPRATSAERLVFGIAALALVAVLGTGVVLTMRGDESSEVATAGDVSTTTSEAPTRPTDLRTGVRLEDGTYEGLIRDVETGPSGHQLTVELMEFFFGDDAVEMALADGAIDEPDGLPNPHYVRHLDLPPVLLDAAADTTIALLDDALAEQHVSGWDEAMALRDERVPQSGPRIQAWPVELDVRDGTVIAIRQFYAP